MAAMFPEPPLVFGHWLILSENAAKDCFEPKGDARGRIKTLGRNLVVKKPSIPAETETLKFCLWRPLRRALSYSARECL